MAVTLAPAEFPARPAGTRRAGRGVPSFRDGFVPRPRLVRALRDATVSLAVIVAPAGYGKTTLLSEWGARDERSFVWVSAADDEDGAGLHDAAHHALAGVEPFVFVLDDAHLLREAGAIDTLHALTRDMPAGSMVAVASRTEPPLPLGRLRAHRDVVEIRTHDLAMTGAEAKALLAMAGADVAGDELERVLRDTEGWPTGLYLAALSSRQDVVSDYFRDEHLKKLAPGLVTFLRRASVLDRLSGPLCDAVLDRSGSASVLSDLARRNLMLVPLDRQGEWFRFHPLFRATMRGELRRLEPDLESGLHRNASMWHERQDEVDDAIGHAIAAGDAVRSGTLLWASVPRLVAHGRNGAVKGWLGRFSEAQIAAEPALSLTAAHSHLADGDLAMAMRFGAAAERAAAESRDRVLEPAVALLRAAFGMDGPVRMAEDAARAYALEPSDSPWRAPCCLLAGVAHHLTGDRDTAEDRLEEAVQRGAVAAPSVQTLALAQLALLAAERADWDGAAASVTRARNQIEGYGLADYPTSALVYAVAAFVRAHRARVDDARTDFAHGKRLLDRLADFVPWYGIETRLALAAAALRLSDPAGARELVAQATRAARRAAGATWLQQWAAELTASAAAASTAPDALTTAELRVLALLPTHLSFREIGTRLYVTANTVKSQAHSVYRKFDVSSRSAAVARATELGLLE